MPKHFKLCHGDFRPSNIIVGEDGKLYLIDWVHATQGNASGDVARTYLTLYLKDPEIAKKYYNNFCSKTKTDVEYIKKWLPIIAAANLTKNRPEEKELLESWLNFSDLM
jgi:thiamine kinase-like enzyme